MPDDFVTLPNVSQDEVITDEDVHLLTAARLIAETNSPRSAVRIFCDLMRDVWRESLRFYTLHEPRNTSSAEYYVEHGNLIREPLDPTDLPTTDRKKREIHAEIVTGHLREDWSREDLLKALQILHYASEGGIGPEYRPEPTTYAALARMSPSSYDPRMAHLGRLRAHVTDLAKWCECNGLVSNPDWPTPHPAGGNPVEGKERSAPLRSRRGVSDGRLLVWYKEYVRKWPSDQPPPTRDADEKAAAGAFPGRHISRDRLRLLRKDLAPADWHKRGAKKKLGGNNLAAKLPD